MKLPPSMTQALQAGLDKRHGQGCFFQGGPPADEIGAVDFGSNDTLGIRKSPGAHQLFQQEMAAVPDFFLGAGGSRVLDGSNEHVARLEQCLADFHVAEEAIFFNSGYEANVAIYRALPQPGDAIVHDAQIHASIRDGIRMGRASIVQAFAHNSLPGLDAALESVRGCSAGIREGANTVFIALESFYSMEGDAAPVREILARVKHALPAGNYMVVVDEAHSTGLLGPNGSGYIRHLGLEQECILQMQSYGKGPGALGGVVLCNAMIKSYLFNYARGLMYSTGPTLPTIAVIRASVALLRSPEGEERRQRLRQRVHLFHRAVAQDPRWRTITESNVLRIPSLTDGTGQGEHQQDQICVPIIPAVTRPGQCHRLQERLLQHRFRTHALRYPVVPRDEERVRIMLHADNTLDEIREFVRVMLDWAWEGVRAGGQSRL